MSHQGCPAVEFIVGLLKTSSGRVQKFELRDKKSAGDTDWIAPYNETRRALAVAAVNGRTGHAPSPPSTSSRATAS